MFILYIYLQLLNNFSKGSFGDGEDKKCHGLAFLYQCNIQTQNTMS